MRNIVLAIISILFLQYCEYSPNTRTQIAIVGGGASGVSAALQAARMGNEVLIIESTEWLGGMLTSAGVSAIDGNHNMPSGIWGEFRSHLYDHYGGPDSVFTGWVSRTLFEPSVGNEILQKMVAQEENITVLNGWLIDSVTVVDNQITKAHFFNQDNERKTVIADVFIDGTEYGDLLALAGASYSLQMETFEETKEDAAPREKHPYVQDLTYVAILEDIGPNSLSLVEKPANYDASEFDCMCKQVCTKPAQDLIDCDFMLDYGRLPNDKFMINWPTKGNDYYAEILEKNYTERDSILHLAKEFTQSWIYFMQTVGGYTNLVLAENEFPSEDGYPLIPYIRESRRLVGVDRLFLYDIIDPYALPERTIYKSGIAVGDYPVDHHRKKNPVPKQFDFPKIPSYNVPYGTLVPETINGLLVAEKSISVSNLVNGTTRLQPVVLQLGQAAGAAASLAVQGGKQPRDIDVRELQKVLLDAGMWLMPYMDTQPDNPAFTSIQRVGLSGIMRGEGIPFQWANETRFYPDSTVEISNFEEILTRLGLTGGANATDLVSQEQAISFFAASLNITNQSIPEETWYKNTNEMLGFSGDDTPITRGQLAWLVDNLFDPFNSDPVGIGYPNPLLD